MDSKRRYTQSAKNKKLADASGGQRQIALHQLDFSRILDMSRPVGRGAGDKPLQECRGQESPCKALTN